MSCLAKLHSAIECNHANLVAATRAELGDIGKSKYAFQVIDVQVLDQVPGDCDSEEQWPAATVCVFGVDVDGHSVMLRVTGFRLCIYFELPWCIRNQSTVASIRSRLDREVKSCFPHSRVPPFDARLVWANRLGGYVPPINGSTTGARKFMYARLGFDRVSTMRYVARMLKTKFGSRVCEERVPPTLKFCDFIRSLTGNELQPCGWIGVEVVRDVCVPVSWCDVELEADISQLRALHTVNRLAPLMTASYDIECVSPSGEFPDATKTDNPVVVIGTTYRRVGSMPTRPGAPDISGTARTSYVLGHCDAVEGVGVTECANEGQMLDGWAREVVRDARADCITGYNLLGFDNAYLTERALQQPHTVFFRLSKLQEEVVKPQSRTLSSSAMGDTELHHLPTSGCFTLDMYQWIKNRFTNLKSLSLDSVSRHFLNEADGKIELPYSRIGEAFGPVGNPTMRAEVVKYCARDCDLPLMLAEKLSTVQEVTEMSRVCHTLIRDVLTRGQQIKVYSHILVESHRLGFVVNDLPASASPVSDEKYTGATVLQPEPGFYNKVPIITTDFNSLYPSIMCSKNLCFSSWIPPGTTIPPGVQYQTFTLGGGRTTQFVTTKSLKGVLPSVLQALLHARKTTRNQLKLLPLGSDERNLLDGRQLAYKISANSCYGYTGATNGMYSLKAIAETTTCVGRSMIDDTKRIMEERYGARVIYGDSVTGDTPVLLRIDGLLCYRTIDDLPHPMWERFRGGKGRARPRNVEVWTETGFTKVNAVIRHKTDKEVFRVTTRSGTVDVTEDHGLLDPVGNKVSPKQIQVGADLLTANLPQSVAAETNIRDPVGAAFARGLFYADGDLRHNASGTGWVIRHPDRALLQKCGAILQDDEVSFELIDETSASGVLQLVASGRNLEAFVDSWGGEFYDKRCSKKVPELILGSSTAVRKSFLDGYEAGHTIDGSGLVAEGKIGSAGLFYVYSSLGHTVRFDATSDNLVVCRRAGPQNLPHDRPGRVLRLTSLGRTEQYVYDLETENHHFSAGIGKLIVHNTDSVMVQFPIDLANKSERQLLAESFAVGVDASTSVTQHFGIGFKLEVEKASLPYILYGKKTYAARVFETPDAEPKLDVKGLAVVRRDTCEFAAKTMQATLNALVMDRSVAGARKIVTDSIDRLVRNEVPIEDLTISKRLSGSYANANLPHLAVVRKMEQRNPGSAPRSGDRVSFVMVENSNRKAKGYEKSEDPVYVRTHGIKIDRTHYLTNNLIKPVSQLFAPFDAEPSRMFAGALNELERQRTRQPKLFSTCATETRAPPTPRMREVVKRKRQTTLCTAFVKATDQHGAEANASTPDVASQKRHQRTLIR